MARLDTNAQPISTPWGPAGAVILCLLPLLFLILVTMVKRIMLPSRVSLPIAAALMALVRLAYLSAPPLEVLPPMVNGCLEAFIPLSVVFGAILLFKSMEHTKCMPWMMLHVKNLSAGNPVAEIFLIGWSFAYIIEGIGGFGAPVALGAPMLVSLGHDPLLSVVVMVILNSICSHIGSVGMVIWFGFKGLNLGDQNILLIGSKAAVLVGVATFVCAPFAAAFLVPWRELMRNWLFVLLSLLSAVVPTFVVAMFSQDFPVVIGGVVSLICTGLMVVSKFGLKPPLNDATGSIQRAATLNAEAQAAVAQMEAAAAAAAAAATSDKLCPADDMKDIEAAAANVGKGSAEVSLGELSRVSRRRSRVLGDLAAVLPGTALSFTAAAAASSSIAAQAATARRLPADAENARLWSAMAVDQGDILKRGDIDSCSMIRLTSPFAIQSMQSSSITRDRSFITRRLSLSSRSQGMQPQQQQQDGVTIGTPVVLGCIAGGGLPNAGSVPRHYQLQSLGLNSNCSGSYPHSLAVTTPGSRPGSKEQSLVLAGSGAAVAGQPLEVLVEVPPLTLKDAVLRTMGIWLTVLILLITRVPQLKIKELVMQTTPAFYINLGTLGTFSMSSSLVMQLKGILTDPNSSFQYQLLYVPCLLPFVAASVITLLVHRRDLGVQQSWRTPFKEAWGRMVGTISAMMGALALAEVIRTGGTGSPAFILGYYFSQWLGQGYVAIAGFLGALSTFVAGSVMAGNITFGDIQKVAAERIGVPVTAMLALQDAGCCAGKMVCIANILACKAVMNLKCGEGEIIKRTALPALLLVLICTALSCLFLFAAPGQAVVWPDYPIPGSTF